MIRRAIDSDIPRLNELLFPVQQIHANGRPDIFKSGEKKYTTEELREIIHNESTPVFVYDEAGIKGYVFCIYQETKETNQLHYRKSLNIDDLCVDQGERGRHIGTRLYEYARKTAKETHCDSVTLNVWALNEEALGFYQKTGMVPLKTTMEDVVR